ncbi:MAG: hypothetical protein JSR87_10840 [Proteobacteria bacterium]|nr:hypothetical protein [Pseudomonadota bacterium]MBS0574431.1 hypothetical protein [Pseudomonadota bacterium]
MPLDKPPPALDVSMFSRADLVNLCHQRTYPETTEMQARLADVGEEGPAFERLRTRITGFVMGEVERNFDAILPAFEKIRPKSLADIGCGYAFIDLLIHRRYGCKLALIDIEETGEIYFMYREKGAGYSNLATARAFLTANGVPDAAITTINPGKQDLARAPRVEMAISLLSCGFHYPVATYVDFVRSHVSKGLLMDVRRRRGAEGREVIDSWGASRIIHRGVKHDAIAALRW